MESAIDRFIFYTDPHYGPLSGGRSLFDPILYGTDALNLQFAIHHFANTNAISLIFHGGDECAFTPDLMEHFKRAHAASIPLRNFDGHVIRIAGNHDYQPGLNELGFSKAGLQDALLMSNTKIIVGTDQIIKEDGRPVYTFNEEATCRSINTPSSTGEEILSTLISSHAAYDRSIIAKYPYDFGPKDKGYMYRQNADQIFETLCELGARKPGAVLSLHGHEHGFRLSDQSGYRCLTMPSLVQEDMETPGRPCGLFCVIDRDRITGTFNIHGKQVILDKNNPEDPAKATVRDYSLKAMNDNYGRRYNVFGPHRRAA